MNYNTDKHHLDAEKNTFKEAPLKRYTLIIICLILLSSATYGQNSPIGRGNFMAAGGFSYTNYTDNDYSVFTIDPSISHFISPGFALGLSLFYQRQSNGTTYSTYGIGPSIRYYIDVVQEKSHIRGTIYPYVGAGMYITHEKYESNYNDRYQNTTAFGCELGLLTMIADNTGIFIELEYMSQKIEDYDSEGKVSISAGLSYFIY